MENRKPRRKKIESVFGENLKTLMLQRQLTHTQIAEMADVRVSVVNDWVGRNGTVPHDLNRVCRLARRLGVSFEWLVVGTLPDSSSLSITELFDEVSSDGLSGIWKLNATRLVPRKK